MLPCLSATICTSICFGFSTYFSKNIVSSPNAFKDSLRAESKLVSKSSADLIIRMPRPPPPEAAFSIKGYPILSACDIATFKEVNSFLLLSIIGT